MKEQFLFTRKHYILALTGILVIALGYLLMIGGGTEDPNDFSDEIFSFRRITLSPILITIGFVILIVTVMYRKRPADDITRDGK